MPQSYDFIFISARDFCEKLQEKLGTHIFNIIRRKSVGLVLCPTDFTDLHRYNDKGLYATMNRWHIIMVKTYGM